MIYVGDLIVDINKQIVSTTIQSIDIGDLSVRRISYTNRLKAPPTENNKRIFDLVDEENSTSNKPYVYIDAKLVEGGIELIPRAKIYIDRFDGDFNINVLDNVIDYFNAIRGLNLADIQPIANSAWTAAGIDAARTNTTGIVTIALDWGRNFAYEFNYFLPCFHYHSIIKSILQYTGLSLSGSILTDERFTDLIIPYPGEKFEYDERLNYLNTLAQRVNTDYSVGVTSSSPSNVVFDRVIYGSSNIPDFENYNIDSGGEGVTLDISVSFRITIDTFGDGSSATFSIAVNGVATGSTYTLNSPATDSGIQTLSLSQGFSDGDVITLLLESDATASDVGIVVKTGTYMQLDYNTAVNRDNVNWNALLPEIKCEDLLKDFFTRFSIIPKLVNNTLYLKSIEEIINDRFNAIDWSSKLTKEKRDINFKLGYAMNNYFNYKDSDDVNLPSLGSGNIQISNQTIDQSKVIYESIFANTSINIIGLPPFRFGFIPVYDSTSSGIADFINEPGLRLLTKRARVDENSITFDAIARTDYYIGYFVDPIQDKDTGWEYFISQFYSGLSESLQLNKIVTKYYNLNEVDIYNYDPHKLIYDGDGYYIINKIINFIPGKITKVELFKVS